MDIFENFGRKIKVFVEKIKKNVWLFAKKLEFLNIFFFELYACCSLNWTKKCKISPVFAWNNGLNCGKVSLCFPFSFHRLWALKFSKRHSGMCQPISIFWLTILWFYSQGKIGQPHFNYFYFFFLAFGFLQFIKALWSYFLQSIEVLCKSSV